MSANLPTIAGLIAGTVLLPLAWNDCRAGQPEASPEANACIVLADGRLEEPLSAIAREYQRRTQTKITLRFLPEAELAPLVEKKTADGDAVFSMPAEGEDHSPVESLSGAKAVAWKHPRGAPVWAAVLSESKEGDAFVRFAGGPTGHRLWAESKAGFTIASGESRAEAYQWIVENRTGNTYPLTAARMLRECGGLRDGLLIDIGCGSGDLDVELAKRSNFTIKGLDIDPDVRPLFEKTVREAGLEDRVAFVLGDAQKLPFDDDSADVIVSRGTLVFIPDVAACLREVDRVLKPTGVAFLGGRYVFTPQEHRMPIDKLREIVRGSGVAGAEVIDFRGQWVKIVGPQASEAARQSGLGPDMLALRFVADYAITDGKCLLVCTADGDLQQGLQRGFLEASEMRLSSLYPSQELADAAARRIGEAGQGDRITCRVGDVHELPFDEASFDAVAGVGPMLLWGDREKGIREIYRVLKPGGAALVGGRFLGMPPERKVSSEALRASAAASGVPSVRVIDDGGQWIEIRKNTSDRGFRD
jgi:ubiquinone/menaquinone biosynthesis C-methylase UbiE